MTCRGCGNDQAWHTKTIYEDGQIISLCDRCGLEGAGDGVPDVYLAYIGQKFENLTDKMGNPIEIQSKRHKAEVMKQLGVREAGDRVNGATFGTKSWIEGTREWRKRQFDKDRPKIREIYGRYLANAKHV